MAFWKGFCEEFNLVTTGTAVGALRRFPSELWALCLSRNVPACLGLVQFPGLEACRTFPYSPANTAESAMPWPPSPGRWVPCICAPFLRRSGWRSHPPSLVLLLVPEGEAGVTIWRPVLAADQAGSSLPTRLTFSPVSAHRLCSPEHTLGSLLVPSSTEG